MTHSRNALGTRYFRDGVTAPGALPPFPAPYLTPRLPHRAAPLTALLLFAVLAWALPVLAAPPQVTLQAPAGGEVWTGGTNATVQWTAIDTDGYIAEVRIYYRDSESADWTMVARRLSNVGQWIWPVHNTPTSEARVRVVAIDNSQQSGEAVSAGTFTILQTPGGFVATTLRDFQLPGSQPFAISRTLDPSSLCQACHGGYDFDVEPAFTFFGSMMHHAARDPLFHACLAIAEQDAPSSGDLCIRCHTPGGWLDGRSQPTDGSRLTPGDRDGVSCDFCHKAVDPNYVEGVSPEEDLYVLQQLDQIPQEYSNGEYVVDPAIVRRGPFQAPEAQHAWLESPFHRSSDLCGTCHSVSNPAFQRVSGQDYAPGPLDEAPTDLSLAMPIERTYHEWLYSDYNSPEGIYAPEFAGVKPGGYVSTCQDCHMRDAVGAGCNSEFAPVRHDLPIHDLTGGNTFVPNLVRALYPNEVFDLAIDAGIERARYMLRNAAEIELGVAAEADSFRAEVTVTNQTGHKLPTGYPEGRRMWINLRAFDGNDDLIYQSGAYDTTTAVLTEDEHATVYEMKLGLSPSFAGAIGLPPGESFHFVLNDTIYKDNRIPPRGFTNANFDTFGGKPVEDGVPERYADGRYWDTRSYPLPAETARVIATLYYQTMSKEYAEFLRDENHTNDAGQILFDLWSSHGKSKPELMVADTLELDVAAVDPHAPEAGRRPTLVDFAAGPIPFHDDLDIRFRLGAAVPVRLEVFDLQGRRRYVRENATLPPGPHQLGWNGVDHLGNDTGSGIFWIRVQAGEETVVKRVVRLR